MLVITLASIITTFGIQPMQWKGHLLVSDSFRNGGEGEAFFVVIEVLVPPVCDFTGSEFAI